MVATKKSALEVDICNRVKIFFGNFQGGFNPVVAGVVDQNIDAAKGRQDLIDKGADTGDIGHIQRPGFSLTP